MMADASIWSPAADSVVVQAVVDALTSTSVSSVAIGSGTKNFTVEPNQLFIVGNFVLAVDAANINNYMLGQIVSYNESTGALVLSVSATGFNGSGTKTAWTITVSGMQGVSGSLSGNVAGNINFLGLITMAQTLAVTGNVSFGALVTLFADPVAAMQAATKQYVDALVPIGSIMSFTRGTVGLDTNRWKPCDGAALNRVTYAGLFAVIDTVYGVGDGVTTFNLPDLRRRTIVGQGGTGTGILGNTVSAVGGFETHTLSIAELAAHTHNIKATATGSAGAGTRHWLDTATGTLLGDIAESAGSGSAHNNMQPSMVLNQVIRVL